MTYLELFSISNLMKLSETDRVQTNEPVEGQPYTVSFEDIKIVGFTNKSKHARVKLYSFDTPLFKDIEFIMSPAMHIKLEKKYKNAFWGDKPSPQFYVSFRKVEFPMKETEFTVVRDYYWVLEVLTPSYNPKTFSASTK